MNNIVFRVNKFGKGTMENLTTGINHASDIVIHHRYKQPESESGDTPVHINMSEYRQVLDV